MNSLFNLFLKLTFRSPFHSLWMSADFEMSTAPLARLYSPLELTQVRISGAGQGFSWRRPKIAIM